MSSSSSTTLRPRERNFWTACLPSSTLKRICPRRVATSPSCHLAATDASTTRASAGLAIRLLLLFPDLLDQVRTGQGSDRQLLAQGQDLGDLGPPAFNLLLAG